MPIITNRSFIPNPVFDIGNVSYDGISFSAKTETSAGFQVQFSPDGTHMMILGGNSVGSPFMNIWSYALSPAWDITSATITSSFNSIPVDASAVGLAFSPDGTRMYISKSSSPYTIRQYALSTAWDVSTAVSGATLNVGGVTSVPRSITFKADGTVLYLLSGSSPMVVFQYDLSPAWDITTASINGSMNALPAGSGEVSQYGLAVVQNGEKVFVCGVQTNSIFQFSTSTPYDVTTGTYDNKSFDFTTWEGTPRSIFFKPNGKKLYMFGQNADTVFQYSLNLV